MHVMRAARESRRGARRDEQLDHDSVRAARTRTRTSCASARRFGESPGCRVLGRQDRGGAGARAPRGPLPRAPASSPCATRPSSGPTVRSWVTRWLSRRAVPDAASATIPLVQVVHELDAVRALRAALEAETSGTYNIVGAGGAAALDGGEARGPQRLPGARGRSCGWGPPRIFTAGLNEAPPLLSLLPAPPLRRRRKPSLRGSSASLPRSPARRRRSTSAGRCACETRGCCASRGSRRRRLLTGGSTRPIARFRLSCGGSWRSRCPIDAARHRSGGAHARQPPHAALARQRARRCAGCAEAVHGDGDAPAVFSYVPVGADTVAPTRGVRGRDHHPDVSLAQLNASGETFAPPAGITPGAALVTQRRASIPAAVGAVAIVAGDVEVSCTFPTLLVTDETPAVVHIRPGLRVAASRPRSIPGPWKRVAACSATCVVWDEFGNLDGGVRRPSLSVLPTDGVTIEGLAASFTRSGRYDVACTVPGATGEPVGIEVTPGLPYELVLARVPNEPVYGIGDVIQVRAIVSGPLRQRGAGGERSCCSSAPTESARLGDGFRYAADGRYRVTGRVNSTDGGGPSRRCDHGDRRSTGAGRTSAATSPLDGSMLVGQPWHPDSMVRGSVDDASGTMSVTGERRPRGASAPMASGALEHHPHLGHELRRRGRGRRRRHREQPHLRLHPRGPVRAGGRPSSATR
jgi:hypothetical protein